MDTRKALAYTHTNSWRTECAHKKHGYCGPTGQICGRNTRASELYHGALEAQSVRPDRRKWYIQCRVLLYQIFYSTTKCAQFTIRADFAVYSVSVSGCVCVLSRKNQESVGGEGRVRLLTSSARASASLSISFGLCSRSASAEMSSPASTRAGAATG